jgi:hypothetical protein
MSQPTPLESPITTVPTSTQTQGVWSHRRDLLMRPMWEIIAICFWLYLTIKLFLYDIDTYLMATYLPGSDWILAFKAFIFLTAIALMLLFMGRNNTLLRLLFILSYPIIILFWRVPYFMFRQRRWMMALSLVNFLFSFFSALRYNVIVFSSFLISSAVTLSSQSPACSWTASGVLLGCILLTYVRRIMLVFRPTSLLQYYKSFLSKIADHVVTSYALDETMRNLPMTQLDETQLTKWQSNLGSVVLFNRICLFAAEKLKVYQNSSLEIVSGVFNILGLIIFTTLSFAAINLALYRIQAENFEIMALPTVFRFIYYSFNTVLFSSIREITPVMPVSQLISMIEKFCALFLIAIFVSLVFTVRGQRYSRELDEAIAVFESEGCRVEKLILSQYGIRTINEAIDELERIKSSFVKLIFFFSRR